VTRPTVSQARAWRPDSLREAAKRWESAVTDVHASVETSVQGVMTSHDYWTGAAADAARERAVGVGHRSGAVARAMVLASVAARDGAQEISSARDEVLALVTSAQTEGFSVDDDGTVSVSTSAPTLLVVLSGGDDAVAQRMLQARADELTGRVTAALERLGAADADAAHDIDEALTPPIERPPATVPAGAWPVRGGDVVASWPSVGQDRIAEQVAAMSSAQRQNLVDEFPSQVGNTDGVPWEMRIAANRNNIAQTILDERDPRRAAFYRGLLGEVDDPAGSGRRVDRQILAFDPARASFVELIGSLAAATSVAVLIPGMGTTIEGSASDTAAARRLVGASRGEIAAITYLGGPFPRGDNLAIALSRAADPRFALEMAPRLVSFSADVDRTVDATGRAIPVTYVGHSYGGSILGTAEELGMTADRTVYLAAAGAGVGVDDVGDWHNRNPDVLRFSMTAPGDAIGLIQGLPGGPHGADPDDMAGVIHLATGSYDDGWPFVGPQTHTDIVNDPASDAWRNVLAVITGDRAHIRVAN
jgi:alpha/beta hydrolase family protein